MKRPGAIVLATGLLALSSAAVAQATPAGPLASFSGLVGHTWRGTSLDAQPVVDVVRFDAILNGQALRAMHSVGGGVYGGETLVVPDGDGLALFYATTAGFHATGSVTVLGPGHFRFDQTIHGLSGIEAVDTDAELRADGTYHTRSRQMRSGQWVDAGGFDYVQDDAAQVEGL